MEVVVFIGKLISIIIGVLISVFMWLMTYKFFQGNTDEPEDVMVVTWLFIHFIGLFAFFIWCWTR